MTEAVGNVTALTPTDQQVRLESLLERWNDLIISFSEVDEILDRYDEFLRLHGEGA